MGQMTYGLCFGVPPQAFGDRDTESLLEAYTAMKYDEFSKSERASTESWWPVCNRVVPRRNYDGSFIGVFVAAGASGMDGLPYLEACPVGSLARDSRYLEAMKWAIKAWNDFAAWCTGRGITLPAAELWLVECEVA